MGSFLRWRGVLGACVLALSVAVAIAEPASAARDKDKPQHGANVEAGGAKQPPGLVGNVHAQAKGQVKKADEASAGGVAGEPAETAGPPKASATSTSSAGGKGSAGGQSVLKGGSSGAAHHHVIVCHRTGSGSNPYVVINIPWTAWNSAHDPGSSHAHPPLDGRVDSLLADPASRPGAKDGFTADDCVAAGTVAPPPAPPSPPSAGGVSGGALGQDPGTSGQGRLPFTGFPVLIVILAALGAAISSAGIARGAGKKGQSLQRRTR
jgi:hypothetical protein